MCNVNDKVELIESGLEKTTLFYLSYHGINHAMGCNQNISNWMGLQQEESNWNLIQVRI